MLRITCATVLAATANAGKIKDLSKVDAKKSIITMNQAQSLNELALDATCSPPTKLGGLGYCGPDYCIDAEKWSCTGSGKCAVCTYTRGSNQAGQTFNVATPFDYQKRLNMIASRPCTQSSDSRCTSEYLNSIIVSTGIKAAYCNEDFIVVHSDLTGGFTPWLADIPNPPGGGEDHDRTDQTDTGIFCQTGMESLYEEYGIYKFPLATNPLATDDYTNNLNLESFPNGCHRNNPGSHMCERAGAGHDWGHPVRGPVGLTISGMEIFPVYNNMGYLEPQKCEVDSCNAHVGAGGGQTHIHGDPYGAWCMYDIDNYTSTNHHPPQIGWIFDGHGTFGRYLSPSSLGFDVPLDGCGGHDHDDIGYHYHAVAMEAVTDNGRYNPPSPTYDDFIAQGMPYIFTTPGPYVCLKGDISKVPNYWSNWRGEQKVESYIYIVPDPTQDLCIASPNFYKLDGYHLPIHKSMEDFYAFRESLDEETKAMIALNDAYDANLIQQAAESGKALISVDDWVKTTSTYEGDDKMTIAQAMAKAAVPARTVGSQAMKPVETVSGIVDVDGTGKSSATTTKTTTETTTKVTKDKDTSSKADTAASTTSSKSDTAAIESATKVKVDTPKVKVATPKETTPTKEEADASAPADAPLPPATTSSATAATTTVDKKTTKDTADVSTTTKVKVATPKETIPSKEEADASAPADAPLPPATTSSATTTVDKKTTKYTADVTTTKVKVATPKTTTPTKEEADKTASLIATAKGVESVQDKTATVDPTIKDSKIASSRTVSTKTTADVVKGTKIDKKSI